MFLDIIHRPIFYLKHNWILSLSSGKSLLSWAQYFFNIHSSQTFRSYHLQRAKSPHLPPHDNPWKQQVGLPGRRQVGLSD
jgi:hypothetical protein